MTSAFSGTAARPLRTEEARVDRRKSRGQRLSDPGTPEEGFRHNRHDATGHGPRGLEAPLDHGPATESGELLGLTESPSLTGGDNDHPDLDAHAPVARPALGQSGVEALLRLGLAHADREGQLRNEDLARTRQHPLLTGRQAAVLVAMERFRTTSAT